MSFIDMDIQTDPSLLREAAYEVIRTHVPGWDPQPGNLDTWMLEATAEMAAQVRDLAATVPATIFRTYGQVVLGIPTKDGSPAQLTTTWTMRDSAGYTIPAGTLLSVRRSGGEDLAFSVRDAVTVAAGSSSALITVYAVENGADGNGIAPGSGDVQLADALDYVSAVSGSGTTAGGTDPETEQQYLDRVSNELRLMSPRPILPDDFAVLAQRTDGVARALAINGYIPGSPALTNQERAVAVAVHDAAGAACTSPVKAAVDAALQAQREVNFVVNVIDPTFTTVNVSVAAVALPGHTPSVVQTAAVDALTHYLSPVTWGLPGEGDYLSGSWRTVDKVRYLELAGVLDRVFGLDYVSSLSVNSGTSDVMLSGVAPLPAIGTISATVTAP